MILVFDYLFPKREPKISQMITTIDLNFLGQSKVIAAFLVETEEGPVLIETGPFSTFPNLILGLKKAGYKPQDVRHVLLSHIHLDHAGAAWYFAEHGANIYVHPVGAPHLIAPERLLASAKKIYQEKMDSLWGEMRPIPKEKLVLVDHKQRFKIGGRAFRALFTPGHAIHHVAWELDENLFTGDVGGVKIDRGIVVPPCPPPDINLEDWMASISLIKKRRYKKLFLTHFGEVANVKEHLVELQGRLVNWANWIKPYWENNTEPEQVVEEFKVYVAKQLSAGGVSQEGLERYEKANPAWMSVAGLMRYWRKKEGAGK